MTSPISRRFVFMSSFSLIHGCATDTSAYLLSLPMRRAKTNDRSGCDSNAKWQFQQPGVVQRDLRILLQSKCKKSPYQDGHVSKRFHHASNTKHLHDCHDSRRKDAPQQDEEKKYRTEKCTHRAHQFPIPCPKCTKQNQRDQKNQCQGRAFQREQRTVPSSQQGVRANADEQP